MVVDQGLGRAGLTSSASSVRALSISDCCAPDDQPGDGPAHVVDGPQLAGALQRVADGRDAGRAGERGGEAARRGAQEPGHGRAVRGRAAGPAAARPGRDAGRGERAGIGAGVGLEAGDDGVDVGGDAGGGRTARRDGRGEQLEQAVDPGPGDGGGDHDLHVVQFLGVQQPAQVVDAVLDLLGREHVGLVQHDGDDFRVTGERHQEPAVHGGVGILLRVQHPDHQVGLLDELVDLVGGVGHDRVVVRQVEQDQAGHRLLAAVQRAGPGVPVAARDAQPLQQRARSGHAPDAGVHVPGHRPGDPDGGEVGAGDLVEQGGLAASGAAGQRDHGVR
jgi:hypothetical protein